MYVAGLRWDTHNAAGAGDGSSAESAGTRSSATLPDSSHGTRPGYEAAARHRGERGADRRLRRLRSWPFRAGASATGPRHDRLVHDGRQHRAGRGDARVPVPAPPPAQTASSALSGSGHGGAQLRDRYINWTADTVATAHARARRDERRPGARRRWSWPRPRRPATTSSSAAGSANSGTVEAIAPLAGQRDRYVVVTRESTTATNTNAYQGLRPAWHVAIATVTQQAARRLGAQRLAARELSEPALARPLAVRGQLHLDVPARRVRVRADLVGGRHDPLGLLGVRRPAAASRRARRRA